MTQYEMHGIEALGLLKFDFLGLSNLTILRKAVDLIRDHRGVAIDLDAIPLDDAKTFELLASGETTGVFQLESAGMRRYVRELQPTSVVRPRRDGRALPPGPDGQHPGLHPAQARPGAGRRTCTRCSSRTWTRRTGSSSTRRTSWPRPSPWAASRAPRRTRSATRSARRSPRSCARRRRSSSARRPSGASSREVIDAVFKAFEPFERYGFNKAHATCYGLIAYQTAYLKANYTVEYMTSRADRVPRQRGEGRGRGRRVPAARDRGPAAGRPRVGARVHGRGRGDPLRAARGQERRRGRDRVDHRGARGAAASSARSPTSASRDRPAARQPQGARVAGQGRGAATCSGTRRRSCSASTTRSPPARRRSATGSPARRRCSTSGGDDAIVLERPLAADARDAGPRAAPLGEGAARAVPVGPPDGRGRRARRPVRDRLLGRPEGRVARRAARGRSAGS